MRWVWVGRMELRYFMTVISSDSSPRMKDFARRIRSKAMGLIQHAQIIEKEQRRKKQEVSPSHSLHLIRCHDKACVQIIMSFILDGN